MGNLASMGYGASTDATAGENGTTHSASEYVQRLPPDELRKYTEGFRRICRVEAPASAPASTSSSGKLPPAGRSSSASSLPPTPEAAAKRRTSNSSSRAAVVDVGSAPAALIAGAALTKKVFRQKVLSAFPLIPASLSDRLFDVLDTDRTGELSCENVLSGIARLKYGTYDEQVRLLFNIYDLDSAGLVSRDVMDRFMDVVYGRRRARTASTIAFLDRIFESRSSLTLDEFKGVIRECDANGDALLLRWLSTLAATIGVDDDPQILALERSYNPAVIRQRIADATLFSVSEVTALERQFHKLFDTKGGTTTRITHEQFTRVLSERSFPTKLLARVCQATTALDGLVLFDEFCRFVSHFCRGTTASRCTHLFQIYKRAAVDVGDAALETGDGTAAAAAADNSEAVIWSAIDELVDLGRACATTEAEKAQIESEQSRLTHLKTERASASGLSEPQFLSWATDATAVHQLLHQLAFAACILFGVTPESPQLERRIVEWHWTQATVSFSVGETWNLVGASWWHQWCHYAGMHPQNGTPLGALPLPVIPDDVQVARVESQRPDRPTDAPLSRAGSAAANSSSRDDANARPRPGPIANWGLLNRSGSRRLKDKLVFARDFYLIPSAAYAVLVLWYSGGPDLSRSIVEGPPGRLHIELFPLILRVARVDPSNGGVIMSGVEVLLSALSTPASLLEATCKALLLTKSLPKARLWYFDERQPEHKVRVRTDRPSVLMKLTQECVFLLEVQDDDGSWPLSQSSDTISGASPANKSRPSGATSAGAADDGREREDDGSEYTSSDSDEDDDSDAASHGTRQRRKRPRDQRMLSRTSDICSRGNLESLTSVYKSGKSDPATTTAAPSTAAADKRANGVPPSDTLAAATTVKKRFSKDAFTGHGLVGLDNLGNTCYMSSALQCLSHTRLLVEYFKNEAYLRDINLRNRDGTNGKLAVAFGELLRVLWTSEKKRFAPTEFKRVLAKFNPQFTGSDQHDAQELLACLLSSLSEDLNRIMTKPYTEQPDSDGRSDAIVATEWWQNHLQRECSVIVALFTGQYKSLLECSVCHYESARFEPFTFLQLSLPESSFRSLVLTIIFNSGRVPMKYSVRVKHTALVQDVKHAVAQFLHALEHSSSSVSVQDVEAQLAIARVSVLHTVDTLLDGRTPLTQVHEKDQLAVFQLDVPRREAPLSAAALPHAAPAHSNGTVARAPGSKDVEPSHDHESDTPRASVEQSAPPSVVPPDAGDAAVAQSSDEDADAPTVRDELFPVGTSVFVRADKIKEFASARVIGSSATSGTVDVVFPSGARRYFVAQSKVVARKSPDAFVYLVHRRVERSTSSFTNAHITRLFGAPLVLRVSLRTTTTFDLYVMVWKRLRRIFNWQAPPSDADVESAGSGGSGAPDDAALCANAAALALGAHLPVTKFGFCLRLVTSQGTGCSRCEWLDGCLGCLIRPSPHVRIGVSAEETIAIDWDIRTLKEEYDPIQASKIDVDASVQQHKREDNMPLSIERCMDMFTAKERIHEAYCGRCKTHRPATKTMDLWRLPPLLVIQLKRFCYTQVSRRKLHHHVDFPLRGLALEAFVAKQRAPKRMHESGLQYWQFLGGKLEHKDAETPSPDSAVASDDDASAAPLSAPLTPVLDAPATAAVRGADGFLYDLYAVVNHVGALGAGHYFAYVLSEHDGKWKCFNDHQCKDIDEKEVVSSTAYILFYRRRDTHAVPIETLFPPMAAKAPAARGDADDSASDEAQVEQLLEQSKIASAGGSSCVIS